MFPDDTGRLFRQVAGHSRQQHRLQDVPVFRRFDETRPARLRQRPWRHRAGDTFLQRLHAAERRGAPRI